jgi:plasmid stability protein
VGALTIRNVDDELKRELRRRAAAHDRSMEEEVRVALRHWVKRAPPHQGEGLGTRLRKRFETAGRVELTVPPRPEPRPLPDVFDR